MKNWKQTHGLKVKSIAVSFYTVYNHKNQKNFEKFLKIIGKKSAYVSAQNHAYANKSRHTYVCDVCKLSNPEYIHNNWALLCSSCIKSSATKSVYQWLACHMHHTISQICKGMKTQCFHGFRSYQKHEIYFKKVITSLKKPLAALNTFFLFFSL